MKGDFSRNSFRPDKRYSGVRMQQGRVQLDSDWNEQADIQRHLGETTRRDLVGLCGGPKGQGPDGTDLAGFRIEAQGSAVRISRGRYWVHGMLCVNDRDLPVDQQPDLPQVQGVTGLVKPSRDGVYLAYLEAWQRHITALEDPDIREKALGGPDTATRTRTTWQVKLDRLGGPGASVSCADIGTHWRPQQPAPTGTLAARAEPAPDDADSDPCNLPPGAGYRRLENQLYRVEIHQSGATGTATFKWSRENGSVAARWTGQRGNELTVGEEGRDPSLRFAGGQWVELTDDTRELWGKPGIFVRLLEVEGRVLTIDPATIQDPDDPNADAVNRQRFPRNPKIRRWESEGALRVQVPSTGGGWIPLEDGVEIHFENNRHYATGDYWTIPARNAVGDIVWPQDGSGGPAREAPEGIDRAFCPLALVAAENDAFEVLADCRRIFPPLTDIAAEEVSFDPGACGPDMATATTVQDALDLLCGREGNGCTLLARPGPGWESIFQQIGQGEDARICFQAGTYPLAEPAVLAGKGNLLLTGCGPGTRIVAAGSEVALRFEDCRSVTVRDLYVESGALGSASSRRNLNGALTFCGCGSVNVEGIVARCAAGARRAASCLTVIDTCAADPDPRRSIRPGAVRIRGCELEIGHLQIGVLLVNVARARIEDNRLAVVPKPKSLSLGRLLENKRFRAKARRLLVSKARPRGPQGGPGRDTAVVELGGHKVTFTTDRSLVGHWQRLVRETPPRKPVRSPQDLLDHVKFVADRLLMTEGRLAGGGPFRAWFLGFRDQNPATASQGIVLAGDIVGDARVVGNSIKGALQGVRLGVSRREPARGAALMAGSVTIAGNHIGIVLPPTGRRERFGIFAGNCDSLLVEDNYLRLKRFGKTGEVHVEGLRVWGHLGKRMIVRQNHMVDFSRGIRVEPLNGGEHGQPLWLVFDNVASVQAPRQVQQSRNHA